MAVYLSASTPVDLVEGVGGYAEPGGYCAGDRSDDAEEFVVAPFGGFFPLAAFHDVVVDLADELACVAFVEPVEGTHDLRVAAYSLTWREVPAGLWSGLTAGHRLFFQVATTVGCLLFLIVGAVLR